MLCDNLEGSSSMPTSEAESSSALLPALAPKPQIGLWELFRTWLVLGLQTFGGGSSTFFLIHQVSIERGWLEEAEFVRAWALVQISPGINLVKLTALIGYQLRGWPGLIASMGGMLLPSAIVTVLMTAAFAALRDQPLVKAAMKGILPATIGLSLAMAFNMAQPLFVRAHREGRASVAAHILVLAGSALLLALLGVSPVVVLIVAGSVTMLAMGFLVRPRPTQGKGDAPRTP
jgi:chromate transporter